MTSAGYTTTEACSVTGCTYRQIDSWAREGVLSPSIDAGEGSGFRRRYSYHDLLRLKVIKDLLDAGVHLRSARRVAPCISGDTEDLATATLVLCGDNVWLVQTSAVEHRSLNRLIDEGRAIVHLVPLGNAIAEVDNVISTLAPARSDRPHLHQDARRLRRR